MDTNEKRRLVGQRSDWFHSIDVGDGIVTPGVVSPKYEAQLLRALHIPERLDGLRVLDIGTYDGFYAFECERRGAAEVVAIDIHPVDCRCFAVAREALQSKVKYHHMSVYEMDEETLGGKFDLILFPGVFYHLRHILMSFDNIWKLLNPQGVVLVETHVCDNHFLLGDGTVTTLKEIDRRLLDVPLFRFYRKNELNSVDWSNWFGGNVAALLDVMASAGFIAEHLESWSSRAAFRGIKDPTLPREWEMGSYEGTYFQYNPDGTWHAVWHSPTKSKSATLLPQIQKTPGNPASGENQLQTIHETRLAEKQAEIDALKKTLESIYHSRGWKTLSVYYRLRNKVIRSHR